jgi:DNA-nicking Smr family endonuclease
MGRPPRQRLTPEERALWQRVMRDARPLREGEEPPEEPPQVASPIDKAEPRREPLPPFSPPPPAPPPSRPTAIDRRTRTRLQRGALAIDARLDLHGLTQERAYRRLIRFLAEAREAGHRVVLVITGKGRTTAAGEEPGVLRRQVPLWIAQPPLAAIVSGYAEAVPQHGGAGALYVRLRRIRPD